MRFKKKQYIKYKDSDLIYIIADVNIENYIILKLNSSVRYSLNIEHVHENYKVIDREKNPEYWL